MENTSLHPGASLIYEKAKKKVKGLIMPLGISIRPSKKVIIRHGPLKCRF